MIQMKKRHFDVETDGFYGAYWKCKSDSDCAMIAMIGDDSEAVHPITEEDSGIFMKLAFQAARKYPKECRSARLDIDCRVRNAVAKWKSVEISIN